MEKSTRVQLRKIFQGISINFTGTLFSKIIGFATTLLLTNYLTTSQYGTYAYALGLLALVGPVKQFGAISSLKKLIPEYEGDPTSQKRIVDIAVSTTFMGNILVSALIFYFAPIINSVTVNDPLFVSVLQVIVIVSMFESFRRTISGALLGYKLPIPSNIIDKFVYPVIKLSAVAVSILVGLKLLEIAGSLLVGSLFGLLISLYVYHQVAPIRIGFSLPHIDKKVQEYYDFASTVLLNSLGTSLFTKADIVILGFFISSSSIGVYRVSWLLSTVVYLPISGAGQVFPTIISKYNITGEKDKLDSIFNVVSRWTFSLSLILLLGALIYADQLLLLFGENYRRGSQILIIIAIAQFIGSWVGTCGQVLMMHGHHRLQTAQLWIFGGVNVLLNLILIPRFGVIGAVIAMFVGYVSLNLVQVVEVHYFEGLLPVSKSFFKPIISGLVAGMVMIFAHNLLSGAILLFVGGSIGVVTFSMSLYLLGIEEADKEVMRSLIN